MPIRITQPLVALLCPLAGLFVSNFSPAAARCDRAAFRIVLDVGHSPESPGAVSARGVTEYLFNATLSSVIERHLTRQGFSQTMRMLSDGGRAGLESRVNKANARRPDLFLSIHHDSVQKDYLKSWTSGGLERKFSDRFRGWSLFVSRINEHPDESLAFATLLADRLLDAGLPFTTHHAEEIQGENRRFLDVTRGIYRFDELVVLKSANSPAVLMEAGLIINRNEEQELAGFDRQSRIAQAVAAAVDAFCMSQALTR